MRREILRHIHHIDIDPRYVHEKLGRICDYCALQGECPVYPDVREEDCPWFELRLDPDCEKGCDHADFGRECHLRKLGICDGR